MGASPELRRVRRFIRMAAPVDAPVLITGETGTGKSLVARLLHRRGARGQGPWVSVNCAGIPESLFESELFGHERGAFTGAHETRKGLFELAHGGTLFLDEMGDLPGSQQAKLLAVLEDREIRRVGGRSRIPVDVRVVSATSRDLGTALAGDRFRRDLYYRLAVLRIRLPALRERPEDIPILADHILRGVARKHGWPEPELGPGVTATLLEREWPGNVRELAHVLEAALILSEGRTVERRHLRAAVPPLPGPAAGEPDAGGATGEAQADASPTGSTTGEADGSRYSFYGTPAEERELIRRTLERCRGNKSRAARELGMARNTLRTRIHRYELE